MSFDRNLLPDAAGYYEAEGLKLVGRGKWRTTECKFHDGSDSMRINLATGAWVCMNCAAKGGDVLAYHMATTGEEFIDAAKSLGAWVDDGRPQQRQRAAPLPPRAALEVLGFECNLTAIAAGNIAQGVTLTDDELSRLLVAAGRINRLVEAYA